MKRGYEDRPNNPEWEARKKKSRELRRVARELPVAEAEEGILEMIRANQAVVLIGETGSGKTTQVPQFLLKELDLNGKRIGVTQPRRIAAVTIARRVAEEVGTKVGGTVGYAVRFDDTTSPKTKIKYMTDGILMRELLTSKNLDQYSVLILDEAHERTVNSDVLLGLIKDLTRRRSDLKIIVMSATLNASTFSAFWGNCPVGYVQGRTYPVEIFYSAEPIKDIVDGAVTTILQVHLDHPNTDGDILVFLTGQDTIEDCARCLEDKVSLFTSEKRLLIVPLYANLPPERQARAFVPPPEGARKVILSTNVAETSLTIPNIRYVVDSGLVKENRYNPRTGMESLIEVEVSQAQAKQRSGRAGRVQEGECYRMYTEEAYLGLNITTEPEIKRVNLAGVILELKLLGVDDPMAFDFIDPPNRQHLVAALHLLYLLGALGNDGKVTECGALIGSFPITPTHAKALLRGHELGVLDSVVSILAMLSVDNVLTNPSRSEREVADKRRSAFSSPHGDHLSLLNMFSDFRKQKKVGERKEWCRQLFINERKMLQVADVRKQLMEVFKTKVKGNVEADEIGPGMDAATQIRKAFCSGFFLNVAQYDFDKKIYVTSESRQEVGIHPTSVLFRQRTRPPLLIYNELVYTKKRYVREVMSVEEQWLIEAAPGKWRKKVMQS
eukprot:TRINITY_DN1940_c0_g7_i1.p1 TRINITY_DN1940_c0_g7~~TRINITY_DN1940_c0_g7_i1.p1  ORF type:complete len:668 (+),score=149.36 TRINITY_DN1940_c0_g7_i1:57-2060(+)